MHTGEFKIFVCNICSFANYVHIFTNNIIHVTQWLFLQTINLIINMCAWEHKE